MRAKEPKTIISASWLVKRKGIIEEMPDPANSTIIKWRVRVWDEGREPFITQWFNDPTPAEDFLERVIEEAVRYGGQDLGD